MSIIDKQTLTEESARESGNILLIVAARMARGELFTPLRYVSELPQKAVGMRTFRDALERSEETLLREVHKIVDGHDRMAKKLKETEAKLEAAEKRIAELEALIVNEWRGHDGKWRPESLGLDELVYLKTRKQELKIPYPAGKVMWMHSGGDMDVMAYKLATPQARTATVKIPYLPADCDRTEAHFKYQEAIREAGIEIAAGIGKGE